MRTWRPAVAVWAALALPLWAACEREPAAPSPFGDGSIEAIVTDPDLTGVSADEAGLWDDAISDEARALLEQARQKFAAAREAYRSGDPEGAAALAEEGRLLLAEALLLIRGEDAYSEMLQRLDAVLTWMEERVEGDEVPPLLARLKTLREEAVSAWAAGERVRAVERLLLALQVADHARLRLHRDAALAARRSVALGASALELARAEIGREPTERQARLLHRAGELLRWARAALEACEYRRAFLLGRHVVEVTLVAVLNGERPDADDVAALADLARRTIEAAEAAVGDAPTPFQARTLELARQWEARAQELAESHPLRSAALLWRAAVAANLLR